MIAISQVLNVSPFFITSESDERGAFSGEALRDLLLKHKYRELVASLELPEKKNRPAKAEETATQSMAEEAPAAEETVKQKRKYTRKPKPVAEEAATKPEAEAEAVPEPEPQPEPVPETAAVEEQAPLPDIPEEDLQALLHTLIIRSKLGVTDATDKLAQVTGILVS